MSYFMLVDCNNFYASCERLFNPKLEGKPLVVLSSNDGCVVARSQEAKQIGIQMGQPYFQIKAFCKSHDVAIYSSNYTLYRDLSARVMEVLSQETPDIEIYSVDEAFLKYPSIMSEEAVLAVATELRKKIKKWVGLPVSIGIAPTKTLAKMANDLAKKTSVGIFNLCSLESRDASLRSYLVKDVWGIGSQSAQKLNALSIYTAADFIEADPNRIRKKMGVMGEKIFWELRGVNCLPKERGHQKKSITCSRSFGKIVEDKNELAEALSTFVSGACAKMRAQGSSAGSINVFLESAFDDSLKRRPHYDLTVPFVFPTNDTAEIISKAKEILSQLFVPFGHYRKCGVTLLDLINDDLVRPDLFKKAPNPRRQTFMRTLDGLNSRFGKNKLFFAASGTRSEWKVRSNMKSCNSNTDSRSLPIAKA